MRLLPPRKTRDFSMSRLRVIVVMMWLLQVKVVLASVAAASDLRFMVSRSCDEGRRRVARRRGIEDWLDATFDGTI